MLYGLLLDRMNLLVKNGWMDKGRRVYRYFTVKEAQEKLHFGHEKICKLFSELEQADLIVCKRQDRIHTSGGIVILNRTGTTGFTERNQICGHYSVTFTVTEISKVCTLRSIKL